MKNIYLNGMMMWKTNFFGNVFMINFKNQFVSYNYHVTPSGLIEVVYYFITIVSHLRGYNHVIPSELFSETSILIQELDSKKPDE